MLHKVLVVPGERLFVNSRNVTHRTKGLGDSILSREFRAGFGNDFDAIPMGISNSGKLHRLTSMRKDVETFRAWIPKGSC